MTDPSILHVDMDAFFAAVEVLDDPTLAGLPLIVGGSGERGVVAAASYEARAWGVHSAMPSVRARRLCPHARFVGGRYARYQEVSAQVHEIMRSFTPLVEPIALDEAFLDVAGARRLHGPADEIARALRTRVHDDLGLWCSVGVAPRKLTAKLASEFAKPKASPEGPIRGPGVVVVQPDEELAFLHRHPVEALWGVGPATLKRLQAFGVVTVGDLAALPEDTVVRTLGKAVGHHLHGLAWARDNRPVVPDAKVKSIGHEETFASDRHTVGELEREAVRLADSVADRLRRHGVAGRTVSIKVRFSDFRTITRSTTVHDPVDSGPEIARLARGLLAEVDPGTGVRLLGVTVSGLTEDAARQLTFDDAEAPAWDDASRAVDQIRQRFGRDAIVPAALAGPTGVSVKRKGDQQWGPTAQPEDGDR